LKMISTSVYEPILVSKYEAKMFKTKLKLCQFPKAQQTKQN